MKKILIFIFFILNSWMILDEQNIMIYYSVSDSDVWKRNKISLSNNFKHAISAIETVFVPEADFCKGCLKEKEYNFNFKGSADSLILNKLDMNGKKVWFVLQGDGKKIDINNFSVDLYFEKLKEKIKYYENNSVIVYGIDLNFNFFKDSLKENSVISWVSNLIIKIKNNSELKYKKIALTLPIELYYGLTNDEINFIKTINDNVVLSIGKNNLSLGICFDLINRFFDFNWVLKNTNTFNSLQPNIAFYINQVKNIEAGLRSIFSDLSSSDLKNLISITFKFFDTGTCFSNKSNQGELISFDYGYNCDIYNSDYKNLFTYIISDFKNFGFRHFGFWQSGSDYYNWYLQTLDLF